MIEIPRTQWCQCVRAILNVEGGDIAGCVKSGASEEKLKIFRSRGAGGSTTTVSALLSLAGCSESENENVGSLSFDVQWQDRSAGSTQSHAAAEAHKPAQSLVPVNCKTAGISNIEATLYRASGEKLASVAPWNCSNPVTMLNNIPAATNIQLVITGKNAAGSVLYRAERTKLTILYHQITDAGTILAPPFSPALTTPADAALLPTGRVRFSWNGATGSSAYRLQISTSQQFNKPIIDTPITSASYEPRKDLASGVYFWRVMASDRLKNASEWSSSWSVTVDAGPPINTTADNFINDGAATTNSTNLSLAISATKKTGVAAYYISDGPKQPSARKAGWNSITPTPSYAANVPYTVSKGDGEKKVYVWFKDALGRVSRVKSDTIILDTKLPHATITSHPSQMTNSTSASFAFVSSKAKSTFQCRLDNDAYSACTSTMNYEKLPPGQHTFTVLATDAGKQTDPDPPSFTWTIDTNPPRTIITGSPPASTNRTLAEFSFSSSKPESTFRCRLDGAPFTDCVTPLAYTDLASGSHTFTVAATDSAGNTDPSPPSHGWTIGGISFDTTITGMPSNPSKSTSATFSFAAKKTDVTFRCKFDNSGYWVCRSPLTYTGLSEARHTFNVKAVDDMGNEDTTPASYTWDIKIPPVNTTLPGFINRGNTSFTYKRNVKLSISATSNKGLAGYFVSESPQTPEASDPAWVPIPPDNEYSQKVPYKLSENGGGKRIYVWFKDRAGNVSDVKSDTIYKFNAGYIALIYLFVQVVIILA